MSYEGKVVLVTGASSGIGAITAIKFAEEGAKVSIVGRNQERLNYVAKKCENPLVLVADVTKDNDARRIVDETVEHYGQLDILVNNAAVGTLLSIQDEHAMTDFDKVITTNLRAPVNITKLSIPHLKKTKGNIINISSIAAVRVLTTQSFAYHTAKAGLDHFTRCVALDLASSGIRVNTVNPGFVKTNLLKNMGVSATGRKVAYEAMKKMNALNRVSEPEDVADVVLFLASDKAKAITGSSYFTDDGYLLNTNFMI